MKPRKSWWWPTGVASTLAGAAVVAFRGCWHRKMSWPIEVQGYKYQVCTGCGIKRLFNETTFSAYGPYRYEVNELIAIAALKSRKAPHSEMQQRSGD
jgi:hypothetical protein